MFSYFASSSSDDAIDATKSNNVDAAEFGNLATVSEIVGRTSMSPANVSLKDYSATGSQKVTVATSWKQAHDLYCIKHGALKASIQAILSETCEENQEIPWQLPRRHDIDVLLESKEVANLIQTKCGKSGVSNAATPQKSSVSSWLMSPLKLVAAVASVMKDPDEEFDEWVQDGDDAFLDYDNNDNPDPSSLFSSNSLELSTPIINSYMTEMAIQSLEKEICHLPPDTPHVMGLMEWNDWVLSSLSKYDTKNISLSVHDSNFLLQILVDLQMARIIRRENHKGSDVVVLSSKPIATDDNDSIPENLRIIISLWDIEKAEDNIEQKLQELSKHAAECTKNAVNYKNQKQFNLAKTQLAKRRIIQKRIDSDSMIQIKLLQTKNAIESAQSNRLMIDLMADSANLLRELREQTPLEEIDETMDDLQAELDSLQDINRTLSSLDMHVNNMGTEDCLLEELRRLTIDDNVPLTPDADLQTSNSPKKEAIMSKSKTLASVGEEIESYVDSSRRKELLHAS